MANLSVVAARSRKNQVVGCDICTPTRYRSKLKGKNGSVLARTNTKSQAHNGASRAGEKGIFILAPMIGKKRNEDEAAPEEDKKIDGESCLYGFRAFYVFELSALFVLPAGGTLNKPAYSQNSPGATAEANITNLPFVLLFSVWGLVRVGVRNGF